MHALFEYYALESRRVAYNSPVGPRPVEEKPAEEAKGMALRRVLYEYSLLTTIVVEY